MKNLFLFVLQTICLVKGSKILILFPTPAPSHFIIGNALAKGLANANHDITMVSPYEEKSKPKRGTYRSVLLTGIEDIFKKGDLPSWKEIGDAHPVQSEILLNYPGYAMTNFTLNHPNFKKLIHSNDKFDVIILEQFFNDGLKALSCHYKIPMITLNTLGPSFWSNPLAGNPSPPSYIPDVLLNYGSKMNLWERTMNTLYILIKYLNRDFLNFPSQAELVKIHFPKCYPDFYKIVYNSSITFVNSHESTNHPVPMVPSIIPIGGFHINPTKTLPDDLQKFMDGAKNGVIYFSMGTNLSPSSIAAFQSDILRVFGKLKQKVLWKWDEDIEGKPDNVKIQKWFPQQEILAHPNTKLFITHGGLLSAMETVYHGIPILIIPIFGDQKLNAKKMEDSGYGLTISYKNLSEENLSEKIDELLNDPKYQENVKRRSSYFRDRPMKPMDIAIFWTEFVIKHKGAPHLRVAGLDLEWYQYLLLDVFSVIIIGVVSLIAVIYYILKNLLKNFRKSKKIKEN